jgi:hypothetical protein
MASLDARAGMTRTKLIDIAVEFLKLCWLFCLMAAIGVILAWRM